MIHLSHQKRLYGTVFVIGGGIFLLVATVTLLLAAVHNGSFTTASDYTFDATKVEVSGDLAKIKPITAIHDEAGEFTGTYSNALWATDHIELDRDGLISGSGSYTSQIIDSGMAKVEWRKIIWTEVLAQDSAGFSPSNKEGKGDDPSEGNQGQEIPVIADQADRPISDSGTEVANASPPNAEASVIRDNSRAGLLNRETVVAGKSVTIRYRAASGLSPKIDVYDARRVRQIAADPMREIGTTGVYEYHLTLETDDIHFGIGRRGVHHLCSAI